MAQLTVRNLDDDLVAELKARAAGSGRSAEAEHRRILEAALRPLATADFFEAARARRLRPPPATPSTLDLLREGRSRG